MEELAQKFDAEPFEILMRFASGDWAFFGFDGPTKTTFTAQGLEIEEQNLPIKDRVTAAKEACRYLYSQKQSVDVKVPEGIKIIVEDYTKK